MVSPNGDIIAVAGSINVFDRNTGGLKWQGASNEGNYGAPAVDPDGSIYYAAGTQIRKYSSEGQLMWERRFQEGNRLGSTSIIIDGAGNLFFGMGTGKRWAINLEKQVLVYNNNGEKIGGFGLPECTSSSSPALGPDGTLYIGSLDGKLYAFQP